MTVTDRFGVHNDYSTGDKGLKEVGDQHGGYCGDLFL